MRFMAYRDAQGRGLAAMAKDGAVIDAADVAVPPPLSVLGKIICVGLNPPADFVTNDAIA